MCEYKYNKEGKNMNERDDILLKVSDFYKTLSDYTRFRIVYSLLNGEKCVGEIEKDVAMSQTAVSYQLKTLRKAHLVKFTRKGKNIFYSIDDEHVSDIVRIAIEHIKHESHE